jgi:hypothetical protein
MSENDDVRRRLQWLRREHPDAELTTEHVRLDDTTAIFRVAIILRSGGKASGYGSEKAKDHGDFVERAETRVISRALDALGYASTLAVEARPAPAERVAETTAGARAAEPVPTHVPPAEEIRVPVTPPPSEAPAVAAAPVQTAHVEVAPPMASAPEPPLAPPPPPVSPPPPPVAPTPAPPIDFVASRDRAAGLSAVAPPVTEMAPPTRAAPATTVPAPTAAPASTDHGPATPEPATPAAAAAAEPALEDYSFTVFWRWARGLGYNSKGAIEDLIGRPIKDLTPLEVRNLVLAARGEA